MSRLSDERLKIADEVIGRFPRKKSALIPLLHLAQEQDGYVTQDAMVHIAEILDLAPAEVYGTASFYEMFKFHPIGKYCINICTNISCQLVGAWSLLHHAEERLGIKAGSTTGDGLFTIEDVECIAACTEAPAVQVNYRYRYRVTPESFDALIAELEDGKLTGEFPPHGTLATIRQETTEAWSNRGTLEQEQVDAR
ncbi:MAG: NAD(P)H-dependent oxidoreductase subunit E [Ilumatobacteraceae bacterium]|nr:NAD(P)H-dependent oxidoreductase subunit E [Ilumatobacteraceae bacterium]